MAKKKAKVKTKAVEAPQQLTLSTIEQPGLVATQRPRRVLRPRAYDLATTTNTTASWQGEYYSPNQALRLKIQKMRARSRDLWENNDYVKAYGRQLRANVFGPKGFVHQSKIKTARGQLNQSLNAQIERAYAIQSQKTYWSANKQLTRRAFGRRWIEAVARDGAAIVRVYKNFPNNPTGFAVHLLEADYLADDYYGAATNGNRIVGGVEINEFDEAVRYYLHQNHPGSTFGTAGYTAPAMIRPTLAEDVIYTYNAEEARPEQQIGVPWIHTAATRLRQIGMYEQAQLVAAVVSSRKMGFLTPSMEAAGLYSTGETDSQGDLISEVEAGTIEELPPGYDFKTFDPTFPHQELPNFIKAMLRGATAGLGPSYHSLSGDLESVNYSSARIGLLSERDAWRLLQDFAVEDLEREIFRRWLDHMSVTDALPIDIARIPEVLVQQHFQPRGWEYTDPAKEVKAAIERINAGLSTPSIELAKLGMDIEDVYTALEQDRALAESHGLTDFLSIFSIPTQANITSNTDTEVQPDGEEI